MAGKGKKIVMLFGQGTDGVSSICMNRRQNYGIYLTQTTLKRMVSPGNPRSNPQSSETVPSVLLKSSSN